MANIINISIKEFSDIISNPISLFIIAIYLFFTLITVFQFLTEISEQSLNPDMIVTNLLSGAGFILTYYGAFVVIILGTISMYSEKKGNALNVIISKPLYKDSILLGKFIGIFAFFICLSGLIMLIYTSMLLIFSGPIFDPIIQDYIYRLPILLIVSILYILVFLSLSLLVSLLIQNQAYALISTTIIMIISDIIPTINVAWFLSNIILGGNNDKLMSTISEISPKGLLNSIFAQILNVAQPITVSVSSAFVDSFKLVIYIVIFMTLSFIIFMRRDIA